MFGRLLIYLGTAWLELFPDPLPGSRFFLASAVINLTGTPESLPASYDMVLPGNEDVRCTLLVRERYLQTESAMALLRAIRDGKQGRSLLVLIPAMATEDIAIVTREWLELWAAEPDERRRAEFVAMARVIAELSEHCAQWLRVLEGLDVQKSAYLEEVRGESRREGQRELARAHLLRLLGAKFPGAASGEVESHIRATQDEAVLDRWFGLLCDATSLDGFRRDAGV